MLFVLLIGLLPISTVSISAKSQVTEQSPIHTQNTQKRTASSVTEAYRAVLNELMIRINYSGLDDFYKNECRGRLYDIDGNGTEELIVCFVEDYKLIYNIWTVLDGKALLLTENVFAYYAGDGAPTNRITLIQYNGKTHLVLYQTYGETFEYTDSWKLYSFSESSIKKEQTARIIKEFDMNGSNQLTSTTYYIDENKTTKSTFEQLAWMQVEYQLLLERSNQSKLTVGFDDLYLQLKTPSSSGFKDVSPSTWYYDAVNYAVQNGLMNGVGNNQFDPEGSMTRAMLVTVLWRYEGEPEAGKNPFTDVLNGQWYTEAVAWAAANGIVGGVGNNQFEPEGKITREQMATILYRYAEKKEIDTSKRGDLSGFPDGGKTASWAKDAMQWAVAEGIINGSDGKLLPQGDASRAQVATILMRFIENNQIESFSGFLFTTDYFSIMLPNAWKEHYTVTESATHLYTKGERYLTDFYCKECESGWLFSIGLYELEEDFIHLPIYEKLGTLSIPGVGTRYVVADFPSDVQYDPQNAALYRNMSDMIDQILSTFEGYNGTTFVVN
ncbi:MAG: S-layer homology domain-containing protein [Faecousia sp.]